MDTEKSNIGLKILNYIKTTLFYVFIFGFLSFGIITTFEISFSKQWINNLLLWPSYFTFSAIAAVLLITIPVIFLALLYCFWQHIKLCFSSDQIKRQEAREKARIFIIQACRSVLKLILQVCGFIVAYYFLVGLLNSGVSGY